MPYDNSTFGRPNRPQTPVNGIITNMYGEESEAHLQQKYAHWKQSVSKVQVVSLIIYFSVVAESAHEGPRGHQDDECADPRRQCRASEDHRAAREE